MLLGVVVVEEEEEGGEAEVDQAVMTLLHPTIIILAHRRSSNRAGVLVEVHRLLVSKDGDLVSGPVLWEVLLPGTWLGTEVARRRGILGVGITITGKGAPGDPGAGDRRLRALPARLRSLLHHMRVRGSGLRVEDEHAMPCHAIVIVNRIVFLSSKVPSAQKSSCQMTPRLLFTNACASLRTCDDLP